MRKWHRLRDNKTTALPTRLIFYDTETEEERIDAETVKHKLKLGCACWVERSHGNTRQHEKWLTFRTVNEFWDWVEGRVKQGSRTYLLAHNQHFDFIVVDGFRQLALRGWELTQIIVDSNLFIATFRKGKYSLKVLDTTNWFKFSLRTLGERLGLKKLEVDFKSVSERELEVYCRRDVEILKETFLHWIEFIKRHDLGNFRDTISSQAFQAFRHRFMKHEIWIHGHEEALRLERESYRGGRSEAFRLGEIQEQVYALDFNSLYPSVMIDNVYPTKFVKHIRNAKLDRLKRALKRFLVIAKVRVKIDEPAIALKGERLIFPVGEFDVALTSPELEYVLHNGKILKVYEYNIYEGAKIFETYVKELYGLREEYKKKGDTVGNLMTKLMLNSLYGKFGQKQDVTELVGDAPAERFSFEECIDAETGEKFRMFVFGGKVWVKKRGFKEAFNSFPAIASFVTAYGRMKLWNAIKKAGRENVYYCDTDSLFVNQQGYERLKDELDDYKLGALKCEKMGKKLVIFNVKDYVFEDKVKCKGIRRDAVKVSENVYRQPRFLKFLSLARLKSLDAAIVKDVTKTLRREYLKGTVQEDGTVTPFVLS